MTDDEYLKIFEAATKSRQRQSLSIATALAEFLRRRGDLQRDDDVDDDAQEETNVHETPAPIEVIPTPVEEKQQRTPQYVPGMDLNVFRAKINAVNGVKAAENDEDILRGKIKPDTDF